jgi:Ras-related protein Rab-7A
MNKLLIKIWDTAGQEKFRSLGGAFYRGADCCVLVYDITNRKVILILMKSFDNIESWIQEFLNQGSPKEPEKFPFILVGNKIDRESEREVEEELVNDFLTKHPKIKHLLTSAKNSEGVGAAFEKIALASIENKQEEM